MRTAVVYYSLSGNTEYVAKKIADEIGADLIALEPEKAVFNSGFRKFFWNGKSAVFQEAPELKNYCFEKGNYDRVILGSPVWAGTYTPPLRTFLKEQDGLKGKKVAVFLCFSGGGGEKAMEKLKKDVAGQIEEQNLILIDPKEKKSPEKEEEIIRFIKGLDQ